MSVGHAIVDMGQQVKKEIRVEDFFLNILDDYIEVADLTL